jgi:hypothetical protein
MPEGIDDSLFGGVMSWAALPGGVSAHWMTGASLFVGGAVGALVSVYASEAGRLPRIGEATRITQAEAQLAECQASLDRVKASWHVDIAARAGVTVLDAHEHACAFEQNQVDAAQTALDQVRRAARHKTPLYVLLGGVLACGLASDLVLAGLIGLAWPAGLVGLASAQQTEIVRKAAVEALNDSAAETVASHRAGQEEGRAAALIDIAMTMRQVATARVAGRPRPTSMVGISSGVDPSSGGALPAGLDRQTDEENRYEPHR